MSIDALSLLVKVQAEGVKQTEDALRGVSKEGKESKGHLGGLLSTIGGFVGGAAIVNAAGDAFNFLKGQVVDSWNAGMDANAVLAQTVAGLRSTHDASGMTAKSVGDLATSIMNMTGINDDAVQTGENMLLTFTGIGKDVFPQATQAVADMATRMNGGAIPSAQQMNQVALQLGKALNDPAKGMQMLRREGVTFTAEQQAQIKAMEKAGNTAGAQKLMLAELNKEFGGSAAAAGKANGGLAILQAQFENMKESLGQQLIPIMSRLLGLLQPIASTLLGGLGGAIAGITPLVNNLTKTFTSLPLGPLTQSFHSVWLSVQMVGAQIRAAALPILKQLGDFFTQHLLPAVTQFNDFAAAVLIPMFGDIATFVLSTVVPALLQLAGFVTDTVLPAVEQLVAWFRAHVLPVLMTLVGVVITNVLPVLESLAKTILTRVVPPVERIIGIILPILIPAFRAVGWVVQNVVGPALNILLNIIGWLLNKLADFVGWIAGAVPHALSALGNLATRINGFFSDLERKALTWGADMIKNLASGITGAIGHVTSAVTNVAHNIKNFLHFSKPDMGPLADVDEWMPDMGRKLAQGLDAQRSQVGAAASRVAGALAGGINGSGVGALAGGMSPTLLSGGASMAGGGASFRRAGGGVTQHIVLMLDRDTLTETTVEGMPDFLRIGTGVRHT